MRLLSLCTAALLAGQGLGAALTHKLNGFTITEHPDPVKRDLLQKHVCSPFSDRGDLLIRVGDVG